MTFFHSVLLLGAFLCSLVAGLLFAFTIVVMPGIARLDDAGFIRAFQVIDRVIQNRQPLFVFVWVGSALVLPAAAVLGIWELSGTNRLLLIVAALLYVLGVQLPTVTINVPMNSVLQKVDLGTSDESSRSRARADFEARWNRWNAIRTGCSGVASILLLMLLLRV
jgi:uncharacterized membrane protein